MTGTHKIYVSTKSNLLFNCLSQNVSIGFFFVVVVVLSFLDSFSVAAFRNLPL